MIGSVRENGRVWAIGFGIVILLALGFGAQASQWRKDANQDDRITRVTEYVVGTPGAPGKQGKPGIGIKRVIMVTLPAGQRARAKLEQGLLTLYVPRGSQGVRGPSGPRGVRGLLGPKGPLGPQGPAGPGATQSAVASAVSSYFNTHTFICTRIGVITFSCSPRR